MLNENGNTRDLAELLHSHREQIRDAWVKKVLAEPDTYYQRVSREEVSAWAANGVAVIIEILETNSNQVIEKYIEEIAFSRLEIGFPIYEVTNGLLLAKEVILPIVWSSRSAGSIDFIDSVVQLDACLRKIINEFEKLFSQKVHHQLLEESRKKLVESEAMQRTITALLHGLALDEVLEIVCSEAQKLTDAAGSAVLLLEDEEWLRVTISTGDLQPALERLPVQGSFAGKVLQERSPD